MVTIKTPQDFPGSVGEMLEERQKNGPTDPYEDLLPLHHRDTTEVKLQTNAGDDEAAMAAKFGYSQPIAQISRLTQKLYGYQRDGNIQSQLEQSAVKETNSLADIIFDAPCVNREARHEEEEERARSWQKRMDAEDEERIKPLLDRWGKADAFMLQALIVEERDGLDAAEPLYTKYQEIAQERAQVEMDAAELSPDANMFFWCRVRQYRIRRERAHDLALDRPVHDFTEVKKQIAEGRDIHDLAHEMCWPWRLGYHQIMGSLMDGDAHRNLLTSLMAGVGLTPAPAAPWMMPGGMNGMMPGMWGVEEDEDMEQDNRKAFFGLRFGGGGNGHQPPNNRALRRSRNGRGRNGKDDNK